MTYLIMGEGNDRPTKQVVGAKQTPPLFYTRQIELPKH